MGGWKPEMSSHSSGTNCLGREERDSTVTTSQFEFDLSIFGESQVIMLSSNHRKSEMQAYIIASRICFSPLRTSPEFERA